MMAQHALSADVRLSRLQLLMAQHVRSADVHLHFIRLIAPAELPLRDPYSTAG